MPISSGRPDSWMGFTERHIATFSGLIPIVCRLAMPWTYSGSTRRCRQKIKRRSIMGGKKRAVRCGGSETLRLGLCRGTHNDRIATIRNISYYRATR
jgi:hypothetical protein